jgi:ribosomal protein S18 acetylase RimI-like enzyme
LPRDGVATGHVVITLGCSVEYGGRDGFIDDFYLAPEARGEGLAAKFLDFVLAQAALLGIGTPHLETEVDNARATQLYRRAGFEETGRRLMRRRSRDHGRKGSTGSSVLLSSGSAATRLPRAEMFGVS